MRQGPKTTGTIVHFLKKIKVLSNYPCEFTKPLLSSNIRLTNMPYRANKEKSMTIYRLYLTGLLASLIGIPTTADAADTKKSEEKKPLSLKGFIQQNVRELQIFDKNRSDKKLAWEIKQEVSEKRREKQFTNHRVQCLKQTKIESLKCLRIVSTQELKWRQRRDQGIKDFYRKREQEMRAWWTNRESSHAKFRRYHLEKQNEIAVYDSAQSTDLDPWHYIRKKPKKAVRNVMSADEFLPGYQH